MNATIDGDSISLVKVPGEGAKLFCSVEPDQNLTRRAPYETSSASSVGAGISISYTETVRAALLRGGCVD